MNREFDELSAAREILRLQDQVDNLSEEIERLKIAHAETLELLRIERRNVSARDRSVIY
jgi:hypothetical protein